MKTAKALAAGTEPSGPVQPKAYAYHRAMVVTDGGTLDEAVAKARALAKEQRIEAPKTRSISNAASDSR